MDDRRDDWRHGVDENLASLNAGQRVWEREFKNIHKLLSEIDHLIRGDPQRETSGIIGRLESIEHKVSKVEAVLFVDSTGKKGLLHEVDRLKNGEGTLVERWKFATAVTIAILGILTPLLAHYLPILAHSIEGAKPDVLGEMTEQAKHPPNRYHHYTIHIEPPDDTE